MLVLFVIGVAMLSDAGLSVEVFRAGVAPRCESRACNPRMGNLALGRRVLTQTVCGNNGTELYCSYSDPNTNLACSAAKCAKCNAGLPLLSHLASGMSDSSFRHPNTWWQSAEGVESETVQLDLEAEFYFTHLIVVFRSPRPAAMTLERSQDFGRTWKMLQYYASNCSAAFGLEEGKAGGGQDGASCTSKYSAAYPCNRGEVIYRTLPKWESLDPFGEEGQQQLRVTNVRIRLLKHQPCPCQAKDLASAHEALPTQHFAIYDLIVKGSCFCNGHAEQCVPAPGYQPIRDRTNHVVHGKCVCRHNTAGDHCERCAPLYNDRPWQPADGLTGAPQECRTDVSISSLSHQSASVTDTLRAATLIGRRGVSLASKAAACATVCTTLKDVSVRDAKPASTETPSVRRPPLTPANVRYDHTPTHSS
ncbi:Netrin-4 [Larimichthys crocea]|uniref:Uncharacterized protein n=1 Tax=Larimichthys crocea TaxID=215358 RepID=A0ACD3Q6A4_LARCR|nr:Netrin-4 [Larimichthys crocea]